MIKLFFSVLCCFALASCSSSSSTSDSAADTVLTGVFLDSAVEGISYKTETLAGVTNENGEFQYVDGENVTFEIGDLSFPAINAMQTVTPLNMTGTDNIYDNVVVNATVLLQSLDVDANPSNGIEISDQAAANAIAVDFTLPPSEFSQNTDVLNLVANSGSSNTSLISTEAASNHFQMTLVGTADLQSFTKLEYTNLMIGSTANFAEGSKIYYQADGVKFSRRLNGDEYQGTWSLDSDGLICEDLRGGESTYCIADAQNYLMTKSPSGGTYNYSEVGFVSGLTITSGDTLGLSGEQNAASIGTGAELLANGAIALDSAELTSAFSDAYFTELSGAWDWTFNSDGTSLSASIPRGEWEFDQNWSVQNDQLCRDLEGEFPCVTIYRIGNTYRFSLDGRDGTDNLETWAIQKVR